MASTVLKSPSSRRAWIEIDFSSRRQWPAMVALLAEGVDRNVYDDNVGFGLSVSPSSRRAWIEIRAMNTVWCSTASPSSRRAWIEICTGGRKCRYEAVALLAEGVDRNLASVDADPDKDKSPSSRRAWIEMMGGLGVFAQEDTSPSSRRAWIEIAEHSDISVGNLGRPPRGGRG